MATKKATPEVKKAGTVSTSSAKTETTKTAAVQKTVKAEPAKAAEKPAAKPACPANADAPTQRRRLTFKEKKEYDELDEAIPRLEAEKAAIENALSSGTLSATELQEKSLALSRLIEELDEKSMRWLELGEWI